VNINVENIVKKINIRGTVRLKEPMKLHTSFKIGGPADIYARPLDLKDLSALVSLVREEDVPCFILGGGANILVSDRGIRGIVIDMSGFSDIHREETRLICGAGAAVSEVSGRAAAEGLSGLEFIYRMPGSLGGALWMNARCYGRSIGEIPGWVDVLTSDLSEKRIYLSTGDFSYKKSPFQKIDAILIRACFELKYDKPELIRGRMEEVEKDRRDKGHFAHPSAGSVFKNDHSFGRPTGVILERLGLRGMRHGAAQIAPYHANIIINTGDARAEDVAFLIAYAKEEAYKKEGFVLDPEIRFIGDWDYGRSS